MSAASRSLKCACRSFGRAIGSATKTSQFTIKPQSSSALRIGKALSSRQFTTYRPARMPGLMPESEHPEAPKNEEQVENWAIANVDEDEYHKIADDTLNKLYERAEEVVEERDDVEVDYSAGVLSITMPPNGSYVINKQPPNKQIWLSSPISGPKRFDWAVSGESMDQKEGTGTGEWIYLRDGTSFSEVLRKELGIDVTVGDLEVKLGQKSTDPVE